MFEPTKTPVKKCLLKESILDLFLLKHLCYFTELFEILKHICLQSFDLHYQLWENYSMKIWISFCGKVYHPGVIGLLRKSKHYNVSKVEKHRQLSMSLFRIAKWWSDWCGVRWSCWVSNEWDITKKNTDFTITPDNPRSMFVFILDLGENHESRAIGQIDFCHRRGNRCCRIWYLYVRADLHGTVCHHVYDPCSDSDKQKKCIMILCLTKERRFLF